MIDNYSIEKNDKSLPKNTTLLSKEQKTQTISGYASVFDKKDLHGDIIMRGAFKNSIEKYKKNNKMPYMFWQHNSAKPIGKWEKIWEDKYGLFVIGKLLLEVKAGKEAYELVKFGSISGLSIGFIAEKRKQFNRNVILKADLREISLVSMPSNVYANLKNC